MEDGTVLDHSHPCPLFITKSLEKNTGIKAPENAERFSLQDIELYYVSGGMMPPESKRMLPEGTPDALVQARAKQKS